MPTIVTVTFNPSVDESTTVERVVSEHKMRCEHPRYDPGGGGINVARAMRRLGCDAVAVYPSGGPTGALLDALLDGEGVSRREVAIAGNTRINLHVEETATGAQFRFNMPGPVLAEGELRACFDAIDHAGRASVRGRPRAAKHLYGALRDALLSDEGHLRLPSTARGRVRARWA